MGTTTFRLRVWTRYFSPPEKVWAVKTDPDCLAAELRPWLRFSVSDADGLLAAVRSGDSAESEARLLGIRWPIHLTGSTPGEQYADTSTNALFSRFEHTHVFEPTPDGCRYIDDVVFTPALPANKLTAILTRRLFVHRHRVVAQRLPADLKTIGTSILRVLLEEEADFGGL
ncbi:MAG: ligand-binding SRPBCC domain-containing protein [Myxococcota bacterium]|jgi:ligand-binding SRPBCC domain-containing protein